MTEQQANMLGILLSNIIDNTFHVAVYNDGENTNGWVVEILQPSTSEEGIEYWETLVVFDDYRVE